MTPNLAKRNRQNGKFKFKARDWKAAFDGLDEFPRIPMKNGRPRARPVSKQETKSAS